MQWNFRLAAPVALLFLTATAPLSSAAPITFTFTGEVTEIFDPTNFLAGSSFTPSLGDPISGAYTFDSTTPGFDLSPTTFHYNSNPTPPFGMTFQISGTSFEAFPGFLAINVTNDDPIYGDLYVLFTALTAPLGINWVGVGFELATTTNLGALNSTDLPLVPPDVSLFDARNQFFVTFFSDTGEFGFVAGRLSSIESATSVPEPATLLLISGGLVAVAFHRRRRH